MQIALTKKLTDALGAKLTTDAEQTDPLFTWIANWTRVWDNRRSEDMLVLVNRATRFTVAIYQVKRKDLVNIKEKIWDAIVNTLLAMNLNPELVNEYMQMAGDLEFVRNTSRQAAAWVTRAGLDCAFHVGREYNGVKKMYCDTVGVSANDRIVGSAGNSNDGVYPHQAMTEALTKITGLQAYKCDAYELMVRLDLGVYQVKRRLIVPAQMRLTELHNVLQSVFGWSNSHLYDFTVINDKTQNALVRLVPYEDDLAYDDRAVLLDEHRLAEYLSEHQSIVYTYDFGDNWEHVIQLDRVIQDHDGELPYLLEASGKTPPEDVGGVTGFADFRAIILNPEHPEYPEMKLWAGYWTPELSEWEKRPRVIRR
ncbi:MAG: plasmid pRiA4b ORF-3 family protein [Eubacteriales bacterium]|nr:plasmid pRiA4b ORF-3 family protein [Eubacteriales bacterium]